MLNPRQSAMIQDAGYQAGSFIANRCYGSCFFQMFFDLLNSIGGRDFQTMPAMTYCNYCHYRKFCAS